MPRPRKPDGEKMVPVWAHVPPDVYAELRSVAVQKRVSIARVVRVLIVNRLRAIKTAETDSSLTL